MNALDVDEKQHSHGAAMKILFLLSNPDVGGVERYMCFLVPELNRRGHLAWIANLCPQSRAHELWREAGVPLEILPWISSRSVFRPLAATVCLLARRRPDIIHVHGLRADILGRFAARLAGVPVLISGQVGPEKWRRWYHVAADTLTSRLVTCYIANAEAVRQTYIRREHIPASRIVTIYDGINLSRHVPNAALRHAFRQEWQVEPSTVVFAMVANVRPPKDHAGLLEATARLAAEGLPFHVVLVGKDMETDRIEDRIARHNVTQWVTYLGYRSDAAQVLNGADVAVLTSRWEGMPHSLMEAMAMGLPIVASRVGGVAELVIDQENGLLVEPLDCDGLAAAMRRFISSPELRAAMARASAHRARAHFGIATMVDHLEQLYRWSLHVARGTYSPPLSTKWLGPLERY